MCAYIQVINILIFFWQKEENIDPQLKECREQLQEEDKKTEEKEKASTASAAPRRYVAIQFIPRAAFLESDYKSYHVLNHMTQSFISFFLNMPKTQCIRLRASSHRNVTGASAPFAPGFPFGLQVNERVSLILFCTRYHLCRVGGQ